MAAVGFLAAYYVIQRDYLRKGIDPELSGEAVFAAILGGMAGSKLYYFAASGFDGSVLFSQYGFSWYGGLLGGSAAVFWTLRRSKRLRAFDSDRRIPAALDSIALSLPLGQAFGRVGCFLSGDGDYGPPTDLPWAFDFSNGAVPSVVDGQTIMTHPTPLYDIVLLLIGFAALYALRGRLGRFPGAMSGLALIAMAAERFVTEFWRLTRVFSFQKTPMGWESRSLPDLVRGTDQAFDGTLLVHGISEFQLWSLLAMAAGAALVWRSTRERPQDGSA